MQRSQACPLCKAEWDGQHYVGEKAITMSESYRNGRRQTGQRAPREAEGSEDNEDNP